MHHTTPAPITFPDDFWWGAATAPHQIEGNNINSDWWVREHRVGTDVAEPSLDAADSYHRYRDDIAALASTGLGMYRFGIEWARIEPEKGCFSKAELYHYRDMIDACREAGLEPMVTLHHFTHPRWFADQGGWRNEESTDLFARYVSYVSQILGDITWVCTINEPNMVSMTRGEEGTDMAAASLPTPDKEIARSLVKAHKAAVEVLRGIPSIRSGWSVATQAFHALPGAEEATAAYGYWREDFFLEAASGDDWLGVQAYLRTFIDSDGNPVPVAADAEKTLTGWEYFPGALEIGIRRAWELSGHTPLFVTENGLATSDDNRRIDYTHDALVGLHQAMEDGIEVIGYLHWSALDNYEWGSYIPTFGLIAWDPETFERTIKPSAYWLGSVATTGRLTHPHR